MTARVLRRGRAGYPPLLAQLYDPPAQLYLRGEADLSQATHFEAPDG